MAGSSPAAYASAGATEFEKIQAAGVGDEHGGRVDGSFATMFLFAGLKAPDGLGT